VSYPIEDWFRAFVFTQMVEVPVYVLAMRHAQRTGWSERPRGLHLQILLAFGATLITHPGVWYLIPNVADPRRAYVEYVVVAETWAVVVEAFYFYSCHVAWLGRAFVWSLLANALSAGLGAASRYYTGWP
jgi:hypothetical protein